MSFIWMNGKLIPEGRAVISVFDSAYQHGYGVFETLHTTRGKVLFLHLHLKRWEQDASLLKLHLPYSADRLAKEIKRTLRKNRLHLRDATIRMRLSQLPSGDPQLTIQTQPYNPYPSSFYQKGAKLILVRSVQNDASTIASIKTTNYLTKQLARQEIAKKGAVEGVLLNAWGEVTEGASSNLFIVQEGGLLTPPIRSGLLPGVRRAVVIRLARRLKIQIEERALHLEDLAEANELFITSTLKEILPIRTFEGKRIGKRCPGPVTRQLMEAYKALTSDMDVI